MNSSHTITGSASLEMNEKLGKNHDEPRQQSGKTTVSSHRSKESSRGERSFESVAIIFENDDELRHHRSLDWILSPQHLDVRGPFSRHILLDRRDKTN